MFRSLLIAAVLSFFAAISAQAQDAAAGEAIFKKCMACHQIGEGAKHRSGPILTGVIGRTAGTADGFRFKKDILAAGESGLVWDEANLMDYLENPTEYLRTYLDNPKARSAMSFKLTDEQDRRDMVAYLVSTSVQTESVDTAAGESVFKKCKSCHQIGEGAKHRSGPILTGVVGRGAALSEGFRYKKDIVAAGEQGLVWDSETLFDYLANPTEFLRSYLNNPKARSAMPFKLTDEQDRRDVITYLAAVVAAPAGSEDTGGSEETASTEPEKDIDEIIAAQTFDDAYITDPVNVSAGKQIWFDQCTHCHGLKAYPGKAPKLKPAKYDAEFVFKRVFKGFKKMPAWHEVYTVEEIRQIVAYVKAPGFSP